MAAQLFLLPFRPALDANALVVTGAKLYFYASGTSTPQSVYSDEALTTPLSNPVTADAAGAWPSIYVDQALTYRVVIKDADGNTLPNGESDPYIPGVVDALAPQVAADAASASAHASALLNYTTGIDWPTPEDGVDPVVGVPDGRSYNVVADGRLMNYLNNAGTAAFRYELLTLGAMQQGADPPSAFNIFEVSDPGRKARQLFKPTNRGTHIGEQFSGVGVEFRPVGSGANGPANADVGFTVSAIKTTTAVGEMDGVYIAIQQQGIGSDTAGVLCDLSRKGGTGFSAQWEGVTKEVDPGTGTITSALRTQFGVNDTVGNVGIGFYASAELGTYDYGLLLRSNPGIFTDFISCIFGSNPTPVFNVDGQGAIDVRKGGLGDASGVQRVKTGFAATGTTGAPGNTLSAIEEFRNYTTAGDWTTAEYRIRYSVDGSTGADSSPWMAFRGRTGSKSDIVFGFGGSGSPAVTLTREGALVIAGLPAASYADDTAASAGGIGIGGLYHTSGAVKVRLT